MRKANPSTIRAASADHGRYIYAYCHIRTNQVVYSLSRTLNSNAAIRQLPDLGANNTPNAIRKDLWKPLYTLSLPTSHPHALAQGLHAFKKLREYRKLHELCWEPTPLMMKQYTDAEIEREREKLGERGGSKKESVYDVIKRQRRTMRVKAVMDQKANSVADLAAVLLEQEEMGVKIAELKVKDRNEDRQREVKEMLELAEAAGRGELAQLEQQAEAMKGRLESKEDDEEGLSKNKLRREWHRLISKRARMQFAANAVADANDPARRQGMRAEREQEQQAKAEQKRQPEAAEPVFQSRSQLHRARQLRIYARQAPGGLERLDTEISHWETAFLDDLHSDPEEAEAKRGRLHGLKLRRRQMQLAYEIASAPRYSGDMMAEADDVRVQLYEYKVELAEEDMKEAEGQGISAAGLEELRAEKDRAAGRLERLKTTGSLGEDSPTAGETATAPRDVGGEQGTANQPSASTTPSEASDADKQNYFSLLPSFPPRSPSDIPKTGPLRQKFSRAAAPVYSTADIAIKWNDVLDAEYAPLWPGGVRHERMGWSRYTAPRGTDEAAMTVEDWKRGVREVEIAKGHGYQWREARANGEGDSGRVEEEKLRRQGFLDGVKSEVLRRVREMHSKRRRGGTGGLPAPRGAEEEVGA